MIPTRFVANEAPPGVEVRWLDRPNEYGFPLWSTRPKIKPRLLLLHTNGASNPGSIESAFNWANQYNSNTKPHYQVQRDGSAAKMLPSDRKGIGNYRAADFSLVVETQDLGYGPGKPGEAAGYTEAQRATIVAIVAYESLTHGIPFVVPTSWDGHGIGSHTDPFGYPYWTNSRGKVCPGAAKKADLHRIIAEAAELALVWTAPPPIPPPPPIEDDDMTPTCYVTDTNIRGTFALVGGRWVPWLFPVPKDANHYTGDHAYTREQILVDQGELAAAMWRERG